MDKVLESLKKDNLVYYIYKIGKSIYDIPSSENGYLIIVDKKWKDTIPNDFKHLIKVWCVETFFEDVLRNAIPAWEVSCLNKKHIIKEHVKMIIPFNMFKLKQYFDEWYPKGYKAVEKACQDGQYNEAIEMAFYLIKMGRFANQVLDYHKIISYAEVKSDYEKLSNAENNKIWEVFQELNKTAGAYFKKRTEGLLNNK